MLVICSTGCLFLHLLNVCAYFLPMGVSSVCFLFVYLFVCFYLFVLTSILTIYGFLLSSACMLFLSLFVSLFLFTCFFSTSFEHALSASHLHARSLFLFSSHLFNICAFLLLLSSACSSFPVRACYYQQLVLVSICYNI